jgi:hypothetical protein
MFKRGKLKISDLEFFLRKVCVSVINHYCDFIYNIDEMSLVVLIVNVENFISKNVNNILLNLSVDFISNFENRYKSNYMKIYKYVTESVMNTNNAIYSKSININDYEKFWKNVLLNYT